MLVPIAILVLVGAINVACNRAKVVASVGSGARTVGAFDGRVYWVEGTTLSWIDEHAERPLSFAIEGADWIEPGNFVVDASGVYFSHHNDVREGLRTQALAELCQIEALRPDRPRRS